MDGVLFLSDARMQRIKLCFSLSHGVSHVDDQCVVSGIISLSATDCVGATRPGNTACTRRSTIVSSVGAGPERSIGF